MYLGRDILKVDGKFEPVMWEAYREKVKRYQGKLLNKPGIQERFENKLERAMRVGIEDEDNWIEIRLVFEKIFRAFL